MSMTDEDRRQKKVWLWIIFILGILAVVYGWYKFNWKNWAGLFNPIEPVQVEIGEWQQDFLEIEGEVKDSIQQLEDNVVEELQEVVEEKAVEDVKEATREILEENYAQEDSQEEISQEED